MTQLKKLDPNMTSCLRFVGKNLSEDNAYFARYGLTPTQVSSIRYRIKTTYPEFNRSLSLH